MVWRFLCTGWFWEEEEDDDDDEEDVDDEILKLRKWGLCSRMGVVGG